MTLKKEYFQHFFDDPGILAVLIYIDRPINFHGIRPRLSYTILR